MENIVRRIPQRAPGGTKGNILRCSFTGYRPAKMPFGYDESAPQCRRFKQRLREKIQTLIGQGCTHFLSGGALGMDMYAAEMVLELREAHPWIVLEMVIPFDGQADTWPEESKARYQRIMDQADIITFTGHVYNRFVMSRRNMYLASNADLLLAAYDGKPGGTEMTIRYARELGVQVDCISPSA